VRSAGPKFWAWWARLAFVRSCPIRVVGDVALSRGTAAVRTETSGHSRTDNFRFIMTCDTKQISGKRSIFKRPISRLEKLTYRSFNAVCVQCNFQISTASITPLRLRV
jgi:hypothetical protein